MIKRSNSSLLEVTQTKRWKLLLMLGAVLISVFFLLFTNFLVEELSERELEDVQNIASAFKHLNDQDLDDYGEVLKTIQSANIPIIVVDENDSIVKLKNLDSTRLDDTAYLSSQLWWMRFYNHPIPIKYTTQDSHYIYYKEQRAITMLRYFPYIQLILIFLFLIISYVAFNTSRMYEQNKIWVGMAKETAHQIGTPLSSLIAWVEYLKITDEAPGEDIIVELEKDIERLQIITERFSKIGSTPELKPLNLYDLIEESRSYLMRRISDQVTLTITEDSGKDILAKVNKNLFSWVIENLTKNAVDAMAGRGKITFRLVQVKDIIYLDIKDTGKGIARSKFNLVFKPGFTTRKRGWGLGLSLAKRIIPNYHGGEIFVKDSEVGKGTTFRIKLKALND